MQGPLEPFSIVLIGVALSWLTSFGFTYFGATITRKRLQNKEMTRQDLSVMIELADYGCCLGPIVLLGFLDILLTTEQIIAYLTFPLVLIWLVGLIVASYIATTLVKRNL
ncbi:MAG: hypothetical protein DRO93_09820 [Candidatus Thorarchaeota archaeon]|nr:MAG: hypothetical protein DRO93_09820 [Candidatus Thorarchaeota archaeon]